MTLVAQFLQHQQQKLFSENRNHDRDVWSKQYWELDALTFDLCVYCLQVVDAMMLVSNKIIWGFREHVFTIHVYFGERENKWNCDILGLYASKLCYVSDVGFWQYHIRIQGKHFLATHGSTAQNFPIICLRLSSISVIKSTDPSVIIICIVNWWHK